MSWCHTIKIENRNLKWLIDTCNSVQSNLFYWGTNFPVSIYENVQTMPPFINLILVIPKQYFIYKNTWQSETLEISYNKYILSSLE